MHQLGTIGDQSGGIGEIPKCRRLGSGALERGLTLLVCLKHLTVCAAKLSGQTDVLEVGGQELQTQFRRFGSDGSNELFADGASGFEQLVRGLLSDE